MRIVLCGPSQGIGHCRAVLVHSASDRDKQESVYVCFLRHTNGYETSTTLLRDNIATSVGKLRQKTAKSVRKLDTKQPYLLKN
ncbi:hypothetical protein Bpfe_027340 [Biomphalaria pfeifferi]|uniref:Uncharacterized protein n=1 Tax=Biomphalaria pfeifferi TaxID=112525 RepID=A0AAD8AVM4_BIOPF|nr:hypothetical protein Bpfe_027340 [Biomphalaria pfeifferi]